MAQYRDFKVQIGGTDPEGWDDIQAITMRGAALLHATRRNLFGEVTLYVTGPNLPLYDNGEPIVVHAFDLVISYLEGP